MEEVTYKIEDKQAIFDFIVRKLHEQGGKSVMTRTQGWTLTTMCAYRGDSGRKCALGWLIPDSEYTPEMEGKVFNRGNGQLYNYEDDFVVPFDNRNFIKSLQMAHDSAYGVATWDPDSIRKELREVANSYFLNDSLVLECWPE